MTTVEDVLKLTEPIDGFLCRLDANKYGIEFIGLTMVDGDNPERELYHFSAEPSDVSDFFGMLHFLSQIGDDSARIIDYDLPAAFFDLKHVKVTTAFHVHGQTPLPSLRMIERHYCKDGLLKSYDFTFEGPAQPGTVSTWSFVYELPTLASETKAAIVGVPGSVVSDSFYFVNNELVMHHKANYTYK